MKRKIWLGVFALFLLASAIAFAQDSGSDKKTPPSLTQDQKDKIFKIENTLKSDTASMQADLQQLRYDLQKIFASAAIDEKQALVLHGKITALRDKIGDRRFQANLEILKVLTPEQREKWENRGMGGRGMWNRGGPNGPERGRMMGPRWDDRE